MKFNDYLNEVYSSATQLADTLGLDTKRAGKIVDESETEVIVGRLCAEGKLSLSEIVSNFELAKNEEKKDVLIDLVNLTTKVMDYVEDENEDTLTSLLNICESVSEKYC